MIETNCKGRRVIVTAGADGIGRAIALAFHERGARVQVCDVSEPALAELARTTPGIIGTCTDVSDESGMDGFMQRGGSGADRRRGRCHRESLLRGRQAG